MRVNAVTGIKTLLGFGPKISASVEARPDGLLLHEEHFCIRYPPRRHATVLAGLESLGRWRRSRAAPHLVADLPARRRRDGFWHETYLRRGGVEAVYVDMEKRTGMAAFAPLEPARGAMFSARKRASVSDPAAADSVVSESEVGWVSRPTLGVLVHVPARRHVFNAEPERLEEGDVLSTFRAPGMR